MVVKIYFSIQIVIIVLLALSLIYVLFFAIAAYFYRFPKIAEDKVLKRIAVLFPCYREDNVIIESIKVALLQDYPKEKFDVIIIADSFLISTLEIIRTLPVLLFEVEIENRTKSKALNYALDHIDESYDIAVVMDGDNQMSPGFLDKINAVFDGRTIAVQGHRIAKNSNSSLAILDAISEEICNNIFRKGHRAVGLSSSLSGSGMAFKFDYFKKLMRKNTAVGGFDKEIELELLKEGIAIEFLSEAIVFDEKTNDSKAFVNQRRRWFAAQYFYFRHDFFSSLKLFLFNGNFGYFFKTIQLIQPQRILLLGAVFTFSPAFLLLNYFLHIHTILSTIWLSLIVMCVFSFGISVPGKYYSIKTFLALRYLPKGLFLVISSMLQLKGVNENFIHTKHSYNKSRAK